MFNVKNKPQSHNYPIEAFEMVYKQEDKNFWYSGRNLIIKNFIRNIIPQTKELSFLDVGCGTGHMLSFFEKTLQFKSTTGLDPCMVAIQYSSKRAKAVLINGDTKVLVQQRKKYDLIGIFDVLEHVDTPQKILSDCKRLLKKNGFIFISVPAMRLLWSNFDKVVGHRLRYEKDTLSLFLKQNGFEIVKLNYFGFLTFIPLLINRKCFDFFDKNKNTQYILKNSIKSPQGIINNIFKVCFIFESVLIKYIPFPIGSSLIVAIKKKGK